MTQFGGKMPLKWITDAHASLSLTEDRSSEHSCRLHIDMRNVVDLISHYLTAEGTLQAETINVLYFFGEKW